MVFHKPCKYCNKPIMNRITKYTWTCDACKVKIDKRRVRKVNAKLRKIYRERRRKMPNILAGGRL